MGLFGGENSGLLQALVFGVLEIFFFILILFETIVWSTVTDCLSVCLPTYLS